MAYYRSQIDSLYHPCLINLGQSERSCKSSTSDYNRWPTLVVQKIL